MRMSKFTEDQIAFALKQAEPGTHRSARRMAAVARKLPDVGGQASDTSLPQRG